MNGSSGAEDETVANANRCSATPCSANALITADMNLSVSPEDNAGISTMIALSRVFFGELKKTSRTDKVSESNASCCVGENENDSVPSVGLTLGWLDCGGMADPGVSAAALPPGGKRSGGKTSVGKTSIGLKPPPLGGGLSVIMGGVITISGGCSASEASGLLSEAAG